MHPQLPDLIRVCREAGVGHVVLAGGLPPATAVRAVKDGGARLICFAPALVLARRLVRSGADALVIEGSEAGGHIGPVSLTVLAQEILPHLRDVPVFVAGGLGRGEAILGYLEMGAAGAQLGTRFAAAAESVAHPRFKQAFVQARARDATTSIQLDERFPVIPVRGLANEGTRRFLQHQAETVRRLEAGELTREAAQLADRAFLGRGAAPGRGGWRRGTRLRHDGPVRRHGDGGTADRRDHRGAGVPGGRRVGPARPARLRHGLLSHAGHAAAADPPARDDGASAPPRWPT